MRKKKLKENKYIPAIVIGVILLVIILVLFTSNMLNDTRVPMGYKKSSLFSNRLEPIIPPKILTANITNAGFSQNTFSVPYPQDGSFYELQVANTSNQTLSIRLVKSPDGDWKDDPITQIPAGEKIPFVFKQIGEYIIENAQNPEQTITVQVK